MGGYSGGLEGVTRREAVRIWLLGVFRIWVGGRTIRHSEWRLRKSATLVKLLALASAHRLQHKVLLTGKHIYVDGEYHPGVIEGADDCTVDDIVRDCNHRYVAVIQR
jgi:hypothetical protein